MDVSSLTRVSYLGLMVRKDTDTVENINILSHELLPPPEKIKGELPLSEKAAQTVITGRKTVRAILNRADKRLLGIVGPCSIHDLDAAREYAKRLSSLQEKVSDTFFLVMRVYFEKPRTVSGWKGFINDPRLDDSFHIEEGLFKARKLLIDIAELGLPVGTEVLDPIAPQYLSDLVTWSAIGARTSESQTHREISSGLSTPVGFKNGTDGNVMVAINALNAVSLPHHFLGINQKGQCAVFRTKGNKDAHVILRGGGGQTNYDKTSIAKCEELLRESSLPLSIMIDCSHGNSSKDHRRQPIVFNDCVDQIKNGNKSIIGIMLESNLHEGNQKLSTDLSQLKYGVSVTDACIDWASTEELLVKANEQLRKFRR